MPKIGKEAFLYLDPVPEADDFAQCSTCRDWVIDDNRCRIHGPHTEVYGSMSCGFFIWGAPHPSGTKTLGLVTPSESGLVDREVRCENCAYAQSSSGTCGLYETLNEQLPNDFDIDPVIDPKGCCNAQTPRET